MYDEGKDEFYIAGNHGKEFDDAFWEKALRSLCDAGCAKLLFSGFGFLSRVLNGRYSDVMPSSVSHVRPMIRVMRFYQIMLGWRSCRYYRETDELPNPRPAQPKKI